MWAFDEGCASICVPANWNYYGNSAGHIRNSWMIKFLFPDLVIAFPGGKGTADMVRQAKSKNIDVWEINNVQTS